MKPKEPADIIQDQESLETFLRNVRKFNQYLCDMIASRLDFTIRLEVRGNKGEVLHCRTWKDETDKTRAAGRNIK